MAERAENEAMQWRADTPELSAAAIRKGWESDPEYGWKRRSRKHDKPEAYFFSGPNKHHGFVCAEDGHVYVRCASLALAYDAMNGSGRRKAA